MARLRILAILLALFVVAACATNGGPQPTTTNLALPDRTTLTQTGDTRIGPMDTIKVNVFGVTALDGEYQVDAFGIVKMPLVGEVSAKGYTALEFSRELERRLQEDYLQNPDVTVAISQSNGEQITVEGSVNKPGLYPVPGELSLLQAVAMSGGPTEGANPHKVAIFREIEGERKVAVFDLTDIRNGKTKDPAVYGNDIVVMDGNQTRQSYHELLRSLPLIALFLAF